MPKIAIITFGCKVNQYESACVTDPFRQAGWEQVGFDDEADIYVINTCTVTGRTDFKSRNAVRKALAQKKLRPGVRIYVTGCYAQRFPEEIRALGEIDGIIDNQNKLTLFESLDRPAPTFDDISRQQVYADGFTREFPEHTRAFVKVQDGCDCFCAYCAVPHARGPSRSRELASVLRQAEILISAGYHEIVLGGVNLGLWGREWGKSLTELLIALEALPGLDLIRLSSIEPQCFDTALSDYIAGSSKLAPHLHIPLQSGSDTLLKRMGRRYNADQFRELVGHLRALREDIALGFDVIIGLPGETEALFAETEAFLNSIEFAYLHVFSYSKRPGTRAALMDGQVHGTVAKDRSARLQAISDEKKQKYAEFLICSGTNLSGLVEGTRQGRYTALSDHYLRIYQKAGEETPVWIQGKGVRVYRDGLEIAP